MKLIKFNTKNGEFSISFRNPIEFINQWYYLKINYRLRRISFWLFHKWKNNVCDYWIDYGIRIIGIESCYRRFLPLELSYEDWYKNMWF